MKVNFEKTDRLIELLKDGSIVINGFNFKGAFDKKHSENRVLRNLYAELVEITESDIPEDRKYLKRVDAFAKAYNLNGENMMISTFDEERFVKYLTRVYWQLPSLFRVRITDTTGNNYADKEGLKRIIEKYYPEEPYKEIIAEVVSNQEPTVDDIEKEFWENCPDVDKIDQWCDIYWERFKDHLKIYEENYYEHAMDETDKDNLLYQYFQDLRLTGLLKTNRSFVEVRVYHIAQSLNFTANGISELFQRFRRLGLRAKQSGSVMANTESDSQDVSGTPTKYFKLKESINDSVVSGYYKWLFINKDIVCTENEWKALFSNDKLPNNWKPITWLKKKAKGEGPHLSALGAVIRYLLNVPKGEKHEDLMKQFFVDENGNPLRPSLPSDTNMELYLMSEKERGNFIK